ncbi:serine O-acetyltransferase [Holdemania filiformis]|uniref:serine O-acetyltransferase n=1 Tax=Holdemania filiformis TaxID=61171 RepID=UPI00242C71F5|nr:DapH/DapD/GlmU-related protein [Holdemania filiformis]
MRTLKEDYCNNSKKSFFVILMYRICNNLYKNNYKKMAAILDCLFSVFRCVFCIDAQISFKCRIGKRIRFPHGAQGVVISRYAQIGDDVVIYHGVTIGINERKTNRYVVIGDGCFIGTGAKIINCKLGDNCLIGANAVAYKDVKDGVTLVSLSQCKEK